MFRIIARPRLQATRPLRTDPNPVFIRSFSHLHFPHPSSRSPRIPAAYKKQLAFQRTLEKKATSQVSKGPTLMQVHLAIKQAATSRFINPTLGYLYLSYRFLRLYRIKAGYGIRRAQRKASTGTSTVLTSMQAGFRKMLSQVSADIHMTGDKLAANRWIRLVWRYSKRLCLGWPGMILAWVMISLPCCGIIMFGVFMVKNVAPDLSRWRILEILHSFKDILSLRLEGDHDGEVSAEAKLTRPGDPSQVL